MKIKFTGFYFNPILCLAFLLLLVSACSKETELDELQTQTSAEKALGYSTDKLTQYLVSNGFDKQQIVFEKDRVIIEGDIILSIPELEQRVADWNGTDSRNPVEEHWRHNYLISNTYNTNIKIWIDPAVPASWNTAVQGAVNNWNSINGSRIGMSIVSNQADAHCRVFMGYENANWVARAYLPTWNGRPGMSCEINSRYNSMAASQKLFTITHEFGHTIGFHHTNQTTGVFIPGTAETDPNSVMNSWVLPWNGFTAGDIQATQILYPL